MYARIDITEKSIAFKFQKNTQEICINLEVTIEPE